MGIYINPGNEGFRTARRGCYVDKSGLIAVMNKRIDTRDKLTCVSRPRRFGKSTAAQMLCAYYDRSCDSADLFSDLAIATDDSYDTHRNRYDVIYLDITNLMSKAGLGGFVAFIQKALLRELTEMYPAAKKTDVLDEMLCNVTEHTGSKFIAIIDEWDAPIRDSDSTAAIQKDYLAFLRMLFKSSGTTDKVFAAAYMTGILPIKKDGSQSAVSEFREYTMLSAWQFAPYVGFSETEVRAICEKYGVDFQKMKQWYDGYSLGEEHSIYNPYSVMLAAQNGSFMSYWKMSSSADSLLTYINMNFDGLSKAVTELLADVSLKIDVDSFQNSLSDFTSKDDVLTLLVHFGYLSYDAETETVRIPNEELRIEFSKTIRKIARTDTIRRIKESDELIMNTVEKNADAVAAQIEKVHLEETSPLHYNNEQSLRSVIKLAYFTYRDNYLQFEELPGGTGFADVVYFPKKDSGLPVLVIELKWNTDAEGAISQIKNKNYHGSLTDYGAGVLLVGISYDKETKKHECVIEQV